MYICADRNEPTPKPVNMSSFVVWNAILNTKNKSAPLHTDTLAFATLNIHNNVR